MRISTSYSSEQSLNVMLQQQSELGKTQLQITTGKRIQSPSDDPVAAVKVLDLQRQINLSQQYLDNADKAENKLSVSEGLMTSSGDLVQRIRELAVQGLSDTNSADSRKAIAAEINQLNQALLGIANSTDVNGEYVFSGYETDSAAFGSTSPFSYLPTSPGAGDGQRNIRVGEGYSVEINEPGNDVFVANSTNTLGVTSSQSIFKTIDDFVNDLNANTVGAASANGDILANIDNGLDAILAARTRVGTRMNAVEQQRDVNDGIKFSMETTLSQVEDLDYAEAISRLSLQKTGLEAAQQTFIKVQGLSLFNYL